MSHGDEFEDLLADKLESYTGDNGVVMLRKQNMSMRRGNFQGNQETDILVDSPDPLTYLGFEAKTRNADSRNGVYFSECSDDQFADMANYARMSGRSIAVAVEARHFEDWQSHAWLTPLSLWSVREINDETKVSWEQCERFGVSIGLNRTYEITEELIEQVLVIDAFISNNPIRVKGTGNSPITDDELDSYRDGVAEPDTAML